MPETAPPCTETTHTLHRSPLAQSHPSHFTQSGAPNECRRVTNNYYGGSPFGFSPFGFSPFGFSPFGFGGGAVVVGAPVGGFSFFSLIFDIFLFGAFVTLVSSLFSGGKKDDKKDDGW